MRPLEHLAFAHFCPFSFFLVFQCLCVIYCCTFIVFTFYELVCILCFFIIFTIAPVLADVLVDFGQIWNALHLSSKHILLAPLTLAKLSSFRQKIPPTPKRGRCTQNVPRSLLFHKSISCWFLFCVALQFIATLRLRESNSPTTLSSYRRKRSTSTPGTSVHSFQAD